MSLLRVLLDLLFPARDTEALVTDASFESLGRHARSRMITSHTVSLLPYRVPLVKACIVEAKFRDNKKAQQLLASVLADYLIGEMDDRSSLTSRYITLVPVPLAPERRKERGYNQIERILALAAAHVPGAHIERDLLVRTRATLPQTSLGGEDRIANVQGAFALTRPPETSYTYIVVDDVVTTGATLNACIEVLENAGIEDVSGLSLAH